MKIEPKTYDLNGHKLVLRSAEKEDAATLLAFIKTVCGETRFLMCEADECQKMTLESEENFIRYHEESDRACLILAELDETYVGNASFDVAGSSRRNAHRANIGIALYRAYTGKRIGKKLFSYTLDAAKACGYETAELTVFAKNVHARGMYESFGFTETGRIKNANKYDDGTYDDAILMMKDLKQ